MLGALEILALSLSGPAYAQTASCPTRSANILFLSDDAWAAVEHLDLAAYENAILQVRAALTCLNEPISTPAAAAMHRAEALSAVMNEDRQGAVLAFRAALRLEPSWTLPTSLAIDGGPFSSAYFEASVPQRASPEPIRQEARLHVYLDGLMVTQRMRDLPVVYQVVGTDNVPLWTGYVHAEQDPPPMPFLPGPTRTHRRSPRLGLSVGAGLAAAAGGALLWTAREPYQAFRSDDERILNEQGLSSTAYDALYDERDEHLHAYLVRASAAGGLGVVAAGLTLGAVITW